MLYDGVWFECVLGNLYVCVCVYLYVYMENLHSIYFAFIAERNLHPSRRSKNHKNNTQKNNKNLQRQRSEDCCRRDEHRIDDVIQNEWLFWCGTVTKHYLMSIVATVIFNATHPIQERVRWRKWTTHYCTCTQLVTHSPVGIRYNIFESCTYAPLLSIHWIFLCRSYYLVTRRNRIISDNYIAYSE